MTPVALRFGGGVACLPEAVVTNTITWAYDWDSIRVTLDGVELELNKDFTACPDKGAVTLLAPTSGDVGISYRYTELV